jgi:hypothetical protein
MPESWVQRELTQRLAPVAAPAELWERIAEPRQSPGWRVNWVLAAVAMVTLAMGTAWRYGATRDAGVELEKLARREAANSTVEFHTGSCAELHDWLQHTAGLEVPLPANSRAQLIGARVIRRRGGSVAAVVYRVAGHAATLFVGRGKTSAPHRTAHLASMGGASLYSWGMRDHVYTLVASNASGPQAGCRLCHER